MRVFVGHLGPELKNQFFHSFRTGRFPGPSGITNRLNSEGLANAQKSGADLVPRVDRLRAAGPRACDNEVLAVLIYSADGVF